MAAPLQFREEPHLLHHPLVVPSPEHPGLRRLREFHDLESVIGGSGDELGKVQRLCTWTKGRWQHDGGNKPERWDVLWLLEQAALGRPFRGVEYAMVLSSVCNSFGIPSRVVGLMTADVETRLSGAGHVVVEAFLQDRQRWVFADPQFGLVVCDASGPLNAVELQAALSASPEDVQLTGLMPASDHAIYVPWISQYLYYFQTRLETPATDWAARGTDATHGPRNLTLGPLGVKAPTVFQNTEALPSTVYTHSAASFYRPPITASLASPSK